MMNCQWLPPYSAPIYLIALAGCAIALWLSRRWASSPIARSRLLTAMRAVVLGLLVLVLLNPTRVTETRSPPRPTEMVLLVDCSQSMALDRPVSRLAQVKNVIRDGLAPLASRSAVQVKQYRFGREIAATANVEELKAEDDATKLLDALERLPSRLSNSRPSGVVVFSDGRTTETDGFDKIAAGYRKLGVPLHVFPIRDQGIRGDVVIQELVIPRSASPGTRVPVHVQLAGYGFKGSRAMLRVRPESPSWAAPLATLPLTLTGEPESHDLVIEMDKSLGDLVIDVSPLPGEAIEENNRVPFRIARQVKKLRVIYMEATGGGQYRYIQNALTADPNIECLSMLAPVQHVKSQRLRRVNDPSRGFPTSREELFGYDVVICSDINRGAFTQEQLNWTVELVAQRGGGFAMVGGNTSYGAGRWDLTVWDQLIPVKMSGNGPGSHGRGKVSCSFRAIVPPEVERHPIWRIFEDPAKNRQALDRMPQFFGTNLIDRLKPAATMLARSDRSLPRAGVMPLFACQEYGRGRTFAMTPDSTAEWGRQFEAYWGRGNNHYFQKFWRNVVRWLGENSTGGSQRVRFETDKVIYRPGQPIQITATACDEKLTATDRYRLVARLSDRGADKNSWKETTLFPEGRDATYHGRLTAPSLAAGATSQASASRQTVLVEVIAYDRNTMVGKTRLDVQVLNDSVEYHNPQPDPKRLEDLARAGGGEVLRDARDLTRLTNRCESAPGECIVTRQPAWDHPALWFLLLLLLAAEWILRRRRGLA